MPAYGEVSYVNSTCTLCPGGCGITVRKVEDRVVKLEGQPGHPINDGGLCLLGLSGAQLLYGPRRVMTPLKKVNGKFRRISWDDAINEVANTLSQLRSKGHSHKVAAIAASDRGTVPELINRFLTVYGSANFIRTPSILDTYELTLHLMHGVQALPGFDVENTDFVLSFGSGILEGWGSPVRMFRANSKWREQNGKVVQIEPRLSHTAAKADNWIPIKTGTEGALALGLAHVIVKESLYNKDFIHNGVDQAAITDLARKFARASKPLAVCGRGWGTTPGSLKEFLAVHALNALVGNLNMAGGIWALPEPDYIDWPELEMDRAASAGIQKGRIDGAGTQNYPHARYLLNRLPEIINSASTSPLELLFVAGSNPLYTMPDTTATKEAFGKIPLVISFSSYMDETAAMADLILPNHMYLERYEDVPVTSGIQYPLIGLAKPVVNPQFDTKHTGDVMILLAQALGGFIANAFPWESYEACLEETLGDKWEPLMEQGYWINAGVKALAWREAFETASRKFEFINKEVDALPRYEVVKPHGDEASFPLVLIPYDSMRLQRGFIGAPPFVIKTVEDSVLKANDIFVEINPETARPLGLKAGRYAKLSTPKGSARVKVHVFDGIKPGLVAMPAGLGHKAHSKFLADKGINVNDLIGPVEDSASGHDAAWGIRAKLSKA
jgi:anaerobic selenocysteine-containing dehydrogenase